MANDRGKPMKIMVPKERVFSRGQGCWNCVHWQPEKTKAFWTERRQKDLNTALSISLESPKGEEDVRVVNIRRNVDQLDHLVAMGGAGLCKGGGVDGRGNPVELVHHGYKCHQWTGKQGASLAAEGGKQDPLPAELADKLDN
jgi:hypothetical protein